MLKLWRRPDAVKGTWRIRGTVAGRRYDESTGTDSRAHAEAILAKRQKDILDEVTWGPERTTTFARAVELYLAGGGEARFLEPLVLAFGPRRLADINQGDVAALVTTAYADASPETVNRQVYTPLISVYRLAHKTGMGPPPSFVRPKLRRAPAVSFPTDAELLRLLPTCSERLKAAVVVLTLTGARAAEVCRLMSDDVDWERGAITFRVTKNSEPRRVEAGAVVMAALRPLEGRNNLFGLVSRWSLNQALRRACKRAGLPLYTSHEVGRHAFAARLLGQGYTLLEVQRAGGWKSYQVVARTYGHLERSHLDGMVRDAGANLVQAFGIADNIVPLQRVKK